MSNSSSQLIVLYCILGAAASVTIGFAISRLYGRNQEEDTAVNTLRNPHDSQRVYMRDVRMHNRMDAEYEAGRWHGKRPGNGDIRVTTFQ